MNKKYEKKKKKKKERSCVSDLTKLQNCKKKKKNYTRKLTNIYYIFFFKIFATQYNS